MKFNSEYLIGLFIPLCIFLDPTSNILLSNSGLVESNTAFPLSLIVVPLVLVRIINSSKVSDNKVLNVGVILVFLFTIWCFSLAFFGSMYYSYTSLLYAFQWVYPAIWFFYFLTITNIGRFISFSKGFFLGSFLNSLYIFLAGLLEIIIYGGLQDQGRVSQNLILPGHYQMYVYMPTMVAYSALIVILLYVSKLIELSKIVFGIFLLTSVTSIIFLGAREAILVFVLGIISLFATKSIKNFIRTALFFGVLTTFLIVFIDYIKELGDTGKVRLITKIMNLDNEGSEFGGRDEMARIYINIIKEEPIFGTSMTPAQYVYTYLGEFAPSAHNYYIDAWAWSGLFGFCIVVFSIISILLYSMNSLLQKHSYILFNLFFLLLLFAFISLFLNVPLRQPLTAPILFLIFGLIVYFSKKEVL